jgi:hypothetical protein
LADFTTTTPELKFSVHTGNRIADVPRKCSILARPIDSGRSANEA